MDQEVKERLISRVNTNPYVNHLGIDFTVVEEGRVEARMPLHDEQRQYSGVIHGGVLAALADDCRFCCLYDAASGPRRADRRT